MRKVLVLVTCLMCCSIIQGAPVDPAQSNDSSGNAPDTSKQVVTSIEGNKTTTGVSQTGKSQVVASTTVEKQVDTSNGHGDSDEKGPEKIATATDPNKSKSGESEPKTNPKTVELMSSTN